MHRPRPTTGPWCLCAATPRCSVADRKPATAGTRVTARIMHDQGERRAGREAHLSGRSRILDPGHLGGRTSFAARTARRETTRPVPKADRPAPPPPTHSRAAPARPGPVRAASSTRSRAGHGRRRTLPAPPAHDATTQRPTRVDVGPRLPRVAMVFTCRNFQRAARGPNSSQLAQLPGFGYDPPSSYLAISLCRLMHVQIPSHLLVGI